MQNTNVVNTVNLTKVEQRIEKKVLWAINKTAFDVQREVKSALPRWLTIRRPNFLPRSVVVDKATNINGYAVVGFLKRANLIWLMEKGGTRKPQRSRTIAVPTEELRRGKSGNISKGNRPAALLTNPNRFFVKGFSDNSGAGLFKRLKKRIVLLYTFEKQTVYSKQFTEFFDTALAVAKENIGKYCHL